MSILSDLIDVVYWILNLKLADSAIVLLNKIDLLSCFNGFNLLIPFINQVETPESISNHLNLTSL